MKTRTLFQSLVVYSLFASTVVAFSTPKSPLNTSIKEKPSLIQVASMYAVAPAVPALVLPQLTEIFRASQNQNDLLIVLLSKRIFLYLLAIIATSYSGWRASTTLQAGESLDSLNDEILKGKSPKLVSTSDIVKDTLIETESEVEKKDENEAVFAALDDVEGVNQGFAILLPLFLASALAFSFFLVQSPSVEADAIASNTDMLELFGSFSTISNIIVCLLFTAAEYRSYTHDTDDNINMEEEKENSFPQNLLTIPNGLALGSVSAASLLPLKFAWPFQNSVNTALAVTVTRAIAPFLMSETGSIRTIALALAGLTFYDVFSVFGTSTMGVQVAGAIDLVSASESVTNIAATSTDSVSTFQSSSNILSDASVMEQVARSKFEGRWSPGLLEMVLVGRVSDVLGLGDIVFPACLVAWGYNFNKSYAYTAIFGYFVGSLLTEVASTLGPVQGLPALIFLTPSMLGCISALALQRGEFDIIWGKENDNENLLKE